MIASLLAAPSWHNLNPISSIVRMRRQHVADPVPQFRQPTGCVVTVTAAGRRM